LQEKYTSIFASKNEDELVAAINILNDRDDIMSLKDALKKSNGQKIKEIIKKREDVYIDSLRDKILNYAIGVFSLESITGPIKYLTMAKLYNEIMLKK
jgi:hypothetical protein